MFNGPKVFKAHDSVKLKAISVADIERNTCGVENVEGEDSIVDVSRRLLISSVMGRFMNG